MSDKHVWTTAFDGDEPVEPTMEDKIADFIRNNLTVRHEWQGYDYGFVSNTLTTEILLGGEVIASCDTTIHIAAYD